MSFEKYKIQKNFVPEIICNIYNEYSIKQQYKSIQFPGYLPISYVDVDNMLSATNYLASRKQSGVRFFAIYQVECTFMYMFDKAGEAFQIPVTSPKSFVCDLEWCDESNRIYILDCISIDNEEKHRFVPSRYGGIRSVARFLTLDEFTVLPQTFYAVRHAVKLYYDDEIDDPWEGIVFTPKDHNYFGTHNPIIKWKPAKQQTFDFKVLKVSEEYEPFETVSQIASPESKSTSLNPLDLEERRMRRTGDLDSREKEVLNCVTSKDQRIDNYYVMYATIEDAQGDSYVLRVKSDRRLRFYKNQICEFNWEKRADCEWFILKCVRTDVVYPNPMKRFVRWHRFSCGLYDICVKMKLPRLMRPEPPSDG